MNFEPDVVWLHIVSDALIALAYFSIPLALVYFVRKRKDLVFNWMFMLFAAFIVACGTTHVFGVLAIWQPYYRLDGLIKLGTGLISITTAALLWPLIPRALQLPSPQQLRIANARLAGEIVERERAEAEARRASVELEQRVRERTAELNAAAEERAAALERERTARAEAERASRLKDDFVATLSHELRTPINAILGWTQLLRADPGRSDAAYGLEVVERNTQAQARMIEDLLDMSRIVAGQLRLDLQRVNLAEIIDAAIETVRPAADARGVDIARMVEPGTGHVRGDPARLQQVVWNLLSNAIKFTPRGGRASVTLRRVDSHVEIVVEDTGRGISPGFLPHVFERFRQEDASTTRAQGGLGLGLAIVRHLVELHGGTVSASSDGEGTGAAFTVALPVSALRQAPEHPTQRHPAPEPADSMGPSLTGLRVLVLDDDADTRDLLERVLAHAGATVFVSASSSEAIALLEHEAPAFDAVISDIGMPGEDGFAFLRRMRQVHEVQGLPRRVPAIALTAFARSEDRTRALRAGFQAHIAKPAEPEELVACVASLTGRSGV